MKILVIGGTRFVGRHLVETALKEGHEITIFNRGKTNPNLFPEAEHLKGDRDGDLHTLEGRKWDVAIDTCGYVPRIVKKSAELLANAVEHYTFISTFNVYADFSKSGIDENSPLATIEDETIEEVTGETYGPLKVLCEKVIEECFSGRFLILRCGLIVGPHDPTDRFTYWPVRIRKGGEVFAPSPPDMQVQFIDARDLAEFALRMITRRQNGIFNTTGPDHKLTIQEFFEKCNTTGKATFTWVDEDFIVNNDVNHLPMWAPVNWRGIFQVNCEKAIKAGLTFRPLTDTIRDTLEWHMTRSADYEMKAGLKNDKETNLLQLWHNQKKSGNT